MSQILTERHDGVAVVTLNDPDRRNALNLELCAELTDAMDGIARDPEMRAVVVTGTPPAFCAGADLTQLGDSRRDGLQRIYDGFLAVARCPLPTIAAVNGAAVGAGMNLALACDVRLAARSARFDTRFLDLGIHPGGGHTWMLRRAVGHQGAAAMVLLGERLDGAEAERVGLAWRCVPDDELADAAMTMAGRAASAPAELVRRTTATLSEVAAMDDHDDAVAAELEVQLWSMDQPAFSERLEALRARISRS